MAVTPVRSLIYGEEDLSVVVTEEQKTSLEGFSLFLLFRGSSITQMVTAEWSGTLELRAKVPPHDEAELLPLELWGWSEKGGDTVCVPLDSFTFYEDEVVSLARQLLSSADPVNLIGDAASHLLEEDAGYFDRRLTHALLSLTLPPGWSLSAPDRGDGPNLLHMAAQYGLSSTAAVLVTLPGGRGALSLNTLGGLTPRETAFAHKHLELYHFLQRTTREEHSLSSLTAPRLGPQDPGVKSLGSGQLWLTAPSRALDHAVVVEHLSRLHKDTVRYRRSSLQSESPGGGPISPDWGDDSQERVIQEEGEDEEEKALQIDLEDLRDDDDDDDDEDEEDSDDEEPPELPPRMNRPESKQEEEERDGETPDLSSTREDDVSGEDEELLELALALKQANKQVQQRSGGHHPHHYSKKTGVRSAHKMGRHKQHKPRKTPRSSIVLSDEIKQLRHIIRETSDSRRTLLQGGEPEEMEKNLRRQYQSCPSLVAGDLPSPPSPVTPEAKPLLPSSASLDQGMKGGMGDGPMTDQGSCDVVLKIEGVTVDTTSDLEALPMGMRGDDPDMVLDAFEQEALDDYLHRRRDDYQSSFRSGTSCEEESSGLSESSDSVAEQHQRDLVDDLDRSEVSPPDKEREEDKSFEAVITEEAPLVLGPGEDMAEEDEGVEKDVKPSNEAGEETVPNGGLNNKTTDTRGGGDRDETDFGSIRHRDSPRGDHRGDVFVSRQVDRPGPAEVKPENVPAPRPFTAPEQPSPSSQAGRPQQTYHLIQKMVKEHEVGGDEGEPHQPVWKKPPMHQASFSHSTQELKKEKDKDKEKNRRSSVFRLFKPKEKDSKGRNPHQFVTIAVSTNKLCDACGKTLLGSKSALHCQSCLWNIHEGCKSDGSGCSKPKSAKTSSGGPNRQGSFGVPQGKPQGRDSFRTHRLSSDSSGIASKSSDSGLPRHNSSVRRPIDEEDEEASSPNMADMYQRGLGASVESLDEVEGGDTSSWREDPDLSLATEPDRWSAAVDKSVRNSTSNHERQRQDSMWELIHTEKNIIRALKVMQKIYGSGLREQGVNKRRVAALFPCVDQLLDVHLPFMDLIKRRQNTSRNMKLDRIGDLLVEQLSGEMGDRMVEVYGQFCHQFPHAQKLYKDQISTDKQFKTFIKSCRRISLCKQLSPENCILLLAQRVTKYKFLVDNIIKHTPKTHVDQDNLKKAQYLSEDLPKRVDEAIDEMKRQERLRYICQRMDAKASAPFKNQKFRKADMLQRSLLEEGQLGWRSASKQKAVEVTVLVLNDCLVVLQESNQKYSFFSLDNKNAVIPLVPMMVREKAQDSNSMYVILQQPAEMYEFECRDSSSRQKWILTLRRAAENCPAEDEEQVREEEEETRRQLEERSANLRELCDSLDQKDTDIKQSLDERMKMLKGVVEIFAGEEAAQSLVMPLTDETGTQTMDAQAIYTHARVEGKVMARLLKPDAAPDELDALCDSLFPTVDASPHPSVLKMHHTRVRSATVRAVGSSGLGRGPSLRSGNLGADARASSLVDLSQGGDGGGPTSAPAELRESQKAVRRSSFLNRPRSAVFETTHESTLNDSSSSGISGKEINVINEPMGVESLPSGDQMRSLTQFIVYLHGLLKCTMTRQSTIEKLNGELRDTRERLKLVEDNPSSKAQDRKGYKHDQQLEELRNLQESVQKERRQLEEERTKNEKVLKEDRGEIFQKKLELEKWEHQLQSQQDELTKLRASSRITAPEAAGAGKAPAGSGSPRLSPMSATPDHLRRHRRSSSVDTSRAAADILTGPQHPPLAQDTGSAAGATRPATSQVPRRTSAAPQAASAQVPDHTTVPEHLRSARNERNEPRGGGNVRQLLPHKLAALSAATSGGGGRTSPYPPGGVAGGVPRESRALKRDNAASPSPVRRTGLTTVGSTGALSSSANTSGVFSDSVAGSDSPVSGSRPGSGSPPNSGGSDGVILL